MEKWSIYKLFNSQKNLIAGSTTKDASKSFKFSLATHTGEDIDKIEQNRAIFMSKFDNKFKFVSQFQVHSDKIINLDEYILDKKWSDFKLHADGFVTSRANIMLNILTADCVALLAYDTNAKIIGAAHAGWKGTKDNIAKNLVNAMCEIGADKNSILVAISPCIRACCYEVGEDVAKHFFDFEDAVVKTSKDKWHLDLSIVNRQELIDTGIKEQNIEIAPICTACHSQNYFSYRKENGCSGRFVSYIGMLL
jgi:YfiH family protein